MFSALSATMGDVSDTDVDIVMEKINGGGGNSVVSVTEVEAVMVRRSSASSTPSSTDIKQLDYSLEHTELDAMSFDDKLAKDYEVCLFSHTNRRPIHDPPSSRTAKPRSSLPKRLAGPAGPTGRHGALHRR